MDLVRGVSKRHVLVAATAIVVVVLTFVALGLSTEFWREESFGRKADGVHWRLSMATGSAALLFLGAALALGPARAMRGRPTPIHLPLRRAVGVTAALLAWIHVGLGITIHSTGWRLWSPFTHLWRSSGILFAFGAALWIGLAAAGLLALLAASSNSRTLRRLGSRRWKLLQRSTYVVPGLLVFHIFGVQILEARDLRHAPVPYMVIVVIVTLQVTGYATTRRRRTARVD